MKWVAATAGRLTLFAGTAVLGLAAVFLGGCLGITAVDAPSGEPTAIYTVTVTADLLDPESSESPYDMRGVPAVRFPGEWDLVSATYSGSVAGRLTHSSVIADFFTDLSAVNPSDPSYE